VPIVGEGQAERAAEEARALMRAAGLE